MWVINFGHPLTAEQKKAIAELSGKEITRLIESPVHFNTLQSFVPQVVEVVDSLGLSAEEWQTQPILICPPGFSPIACCLLAELHGRMGYFPPIVRMRAVPGTVPTQFEVAEIIDLRDLREQARQRVLGLRERSG